MDEELSFKICAQEQPCNYFLFRNFLFKTGFLAFTSHHARQKYELPNPKRLMDFNSWKRDLIQGNRLNVLWKDEFFGMTSA